MSAIDAGEITGAGLGPRTSRWVTAGRLARDNPLALFGVLVVVVLGVSACLALGSLEIPDVVPIPILSNTIIVTALVIMTSIGFVSGLLPAWRAIQVDPAVTLRQE